MIQTLLQISLVFAALFSLSFPVFAENPTPPGSLRAAVYSNTAAEVIWDRASDNVQVIGYEVQVNNEVLGVFS